MVKGQFVEIPVGEFGVQVSQLEELQHDGRLVFRKFRNAQGEEWRTRTFIPDRQSASLAKEDEEPPR